MCSAVGVALRTPMGVYEMNLGVYTLNESPIWPVALVERSKGGRGKKTRQLTVIRGLKTVKYANKP